MNPVKMKISEERLRQSEKGAKLQPKSEAGISKCRKEVRVLVLQT